MPSTRARRAASRAVLLVWLAGTGASTAVRAQGPLGLSAPVEDPEGVLPAPANVDVQPIARDDDIRRRIQNVLVATGWFVDPQVRVQEGVVFLSGGTETDELKSWAGDLARNTQDVVAVANRIDVAEPSAWDFSAAWDGLWGLWREFVHSLPFVIFGLLILSLSAGIGWLTARGMRSILHGRVQARLLRSVLAIATGAFVFLAGVYVVLRVLGLTQLALTVVGGTGLVGLAVGIAFRDITENFLASIFLSLQRPFSTGDLIEAAGVTGYVQQLNVRTTVIMGLDGNLVQIPNSTVYKTTLRNFTANPNRREDFVVGIGYDDRIDHAQEVARRVLAEHPAVLREPEPWVLVDRLGSATVDLRVYFWLDGHQHSWLKVRSSVLRLIKRAFQHDGISMPDEAREVIFPQGIPVNMVERQPTPGTAPQPTPAPSARPQLEEGAASSKAEGGLASEAGVLDEQARQAQPLQEGENLLQSPPALARPAP